MIVHIRRASACLGVNAIRPAAVFVLLQIHPVLTVVDVRIDGAPCFVLLIRIARIQPVAISAGATAAWIIAGLEVVNERVARPVNHVGDCTIAFGAPPPHLQVEYRGLSDQRFRGLRLESFKLRRMLPLFRRIAGCEIGSISYAATASIGEMAPGHDAGDFGSATRKLRSALPLTVESAAPLAPRAPIISVATPASLPHHLFPRNSFIRNGCDSFI